VTTASFEFGQPAPLLNLNDRHHWATDRNAARAWRSTASWAALQLPKSFRPCPGKIRVDVVLPVKRMQRRDGHNFFKTVKPIIDGLVDANVVADDDTSRLLTTEPTFHVSDRVVVTITVI
jgi:Holliday junction resolvase RusA-like endonuclease